MNIFQGARRIAIVIALGWTVFVLFLMIDEPWGAHWTDWLKGGIGALVLLIGPLFFFYLLTLIVGWITRGFMGIEQGNDFLKK